MLISIFDNLFVQVLGESEGFVEQIQRLKDFEFNRELEQQLGKYAPKTKQNVPDFPKDSTLLNQGTYNELKYTPAFMPTGI